MIARHECWEIPTTYCSCKYCTQHLVPVYTKYVYTACPRKQGTLRNLCTLCTFFDFGKCNYTFGPFVSLIHIFFFFLTYVFCSFATQLLSSTFRLHQVFFKSLWYKPKTKFDRTLSAIAYLRIVASITHVLLKYS